MAIDTTRQQELRAPRSPAEKSTFALDRALPKRLRLITLFLLALMVAGCASDGNDQSLEDAGIVDDRPLIPYEVSFEGDIPDDLLSQLRGASQAEQQRSEPPRSIAGIRRRASGDLDTLTAVMSSEGYYDGSVRFELQNLDAAPPTVPDDSTVVRDIEEDIDEETETLPTIVFNIDPGRRYAFDNLAIEVEGDPEGYTKPSFDELGLVEGAPARADDVIDADTKLLQMALDGGRAFAKSGDRRIIIDRDMHTMDVTLRIQPGPLTPLGPVGFANVKDVDTDWLERRVDIEPGEPYSPRRLETARQSLTNTRLFSTVQTELGDELNEEDQLPVTFRVRDRKTKSIGFGGGFQTDEGLFGRTFWENRNTFGAGERLRVSAYASPIRQEVVANFVKPDVPYRDWNFLADVSGGFEQTDAYTSRSIQTGVALERPFGDGVTGSLGVAYRLAEVEERGENEERVALLSFPARLDWDFSNSLLDPSRGGRLLFRSTPFYDTSERSADGTWFFKNEVTHTRYVTVIDDPRLVLAFRGRVGSIYGASRDDIPADERFYAGGGGSIRGIAFQRAGPLDDDDDPIGGRSLLELSGEVRFRVTESIGLVAFVDAGTVYDAVLPDFDNDLEVGVGPGLRYVTPIGPIRLDVGFPIDPRDDVDDPYQLYISIGQAF